MNPIDEAKREKMKEIAEEMAKTFTKEYLLAYKTALIQDIKDEINEEAPEYLLQKAEPCKDDIHAGWLIKRGAVVKNWKRRFFVVRWTWEVEYFKNEADVEKKKPKGVMNLEGYEVSKEAPDCGQPGDPKLTIEILHRKRRTWLIQCENEEDHKKWKGIFDTCCEKVRRAENPDLVARQAFIEAYRKLRWSIAWWGYYSRPEGTEAEALGELISDRIEEIVLRPIYNDLTGSKYDMVKGTCQKACNSVVGVVVAAAWKGLQTALEPLKPKIREKVKEAIGPFVEKEKEIKEKLQAKVMEVANPVVEKLVVPHLSNIIMCLDGPLTKAYVALLKAWREDAEEVHKKLSEKGASAAKKEFKDFARAYAYWWNRRTWRIMDLLDPIEDPLMKLQVFFEDIRWWRVLYHLRDGILDIVSKAVGTYQNKFTEASKELDPNDAAAAKDASTAALEETTADFYHDIKLLLKDEVKYIIMLIVESPYNKEVLEPCVGLIAPIAELIPEMFKELIDIEAALEDVLSGILDETVDTAVSGAVEKRCPDIDDTVKAFMMP